jgi:REP element-mobilizing transposase RayT
MPHRKTCKRFNNPCDAHALTFSCFRRQAFLSKDGSRQWLIEAIDRSRRKLPFHVWAYVIMPDHAHLLVWPRRKGGAALFAQTSSEKERRPLFFSVRFFSRGKAPVFRVPRFIRFSALRAITDFGKSGWPDHASAGPIGHMGITETLPPSRVLLLLPFALRFRWLGSVERWIAVVHPDDLDRIGNVVKLADARCGVIFYQQPITPVHENGQRPGENTQPYSPSHDKPS